MTVKNVIVKVAIAVNKLNMPEDIPNLSAFRTINLKPSQAAGKNDFPVKEIYMYA